VMTTVNDSLDESIFTGEVTGAMFRFTDTLLVLANQKQSGVTPDSVYNFYQAILDTIPYVWQDINAEQRLSLALLSRYRYILWMSNNLDFDVPGIELTQGVTEFITNGGNLLYAGFNPSRFWMNIQKFPVQIPDNSLYHNLFKIDSADRKIPCMMYRANAIEPGYDTLNVDSLKYMDEGYPGNLFFIEVFTPSEDGRIIYRFDTKFDSTSTYGKMKHRPVGLEYMGNDFKSILLSFPLYYMDTSDARDFLHYVMTEKFTHPVGIKPSNPAKSFVINVYPNPVRNECNITFTIERPGPVKLTLLSIQGQILQTLLEDKLEQGTHRLHFNTGILAPGIYQLMIRYREGCAVKKMVKL